MRFDLQKVFGDSIDDNNAKKLFQRSLTLPGGNEFQFVNFLSAHLSISDFFYFIQGVPVCFIYADYNFLYM